MKLFPISTLSAGQWFSAQGGCPFLSRADVPSRFRSESFALLNLLSTGVVNIQTLYFKYREVDVFLLQTNV